MTPLDLHCPHGHSVRLATAPSCMKSAGWYWCGECVLEPDMISMAGGPIRGAYYGRSMLHSLCCDCDASCPPEGDNTTPDGHNVCSECAMAYIGRAA